MPCSFPRAWRCRPASCLSRGAFGPLQHSRASWLCVVDLRRAHLPERVQFVRHLVGWSASEKAPPPDDDDLDVVPCMRRLRELWARESDFLEVRPKDGAGSQ